MIQLSIHVLVALFVDSMFELCPEMHGLLDKIALWWSVVTVATVGEFHDHFRT